MKPPDFPLLIIVGPTGSGKSALALRMALRFQGEIVNYDSVQVFRGLDIGSAKTPHSERMGVAHHLLDMIEPTQELTAGAYSALARACLRSIASQGRMPILVGGTGFYLRSLLEGLSPAPARNQDLRRRLDGIRQRNPNTLHRYLRRKDPAAAARIHAHDHQKLIRGIEIALEHPGGLDGSREPLTGFRSLKIGLNPNRGKLYERLDLRSAGLFGNGLLAETEALLAAGVPPMGKALMSLGYKQAVASIEGRLSRAQAIQEVQTKTRQYAKRQMTWFRRESNVHWLEGFGEEAEVEAASACLVENWWAGG